MKNTYEVGVTPDDNNDRRLPGSCNPEPVRGDSAYGPGKYNMAKPTPLDVADTIVVGKVTMDSGFGMEGSMRPSLNSKVDINNSDTTLMATASNENLSKKYKYPQIHQSVPLAGLPGVQFEDHS